MGIGMTSSKVGQQRRNFIYQLETRRKIFFSKKVDKKISIFKIQGGQGPLHPFPTLMHRYVFS